MCDGIISDYFPVITGERHCPNTFQQLHEPLFVLARMFEKSSCVVSLGRVRITDLDFADAAVLFAAATEVLVEAIESLIEKAWPLELRVSWIKTKIQAFVDILDASIETIAASGENVEVTETFTYLGTVIHLSTS